MKSARVGFTKCLMVMMGAVAANDPSPIILLVPTDEDARGIAVDEVEPIFEATPALQGLIKKGRNDGRNTLTRRPWLAGLDQDPLRSRAPEAASTRLPLPPDRRSRRDGDHDARATRSPSPRSAPWHRPGGRSSSALRRPRKASASSSGSIRSRTSECTRSPALPAAPSMSRWEDIVCEVEHDAYDGQVPVPELRHASSRSGISPGWSRMAAGGQPDPRSPTTVATGSTRLSRCSRTRPGHSSWPSGSGPNAADPLRCSPS